MKSVCVMPARNEAAFLGLTARAALMACDALVILVHSSSDDSLDIAAQVSDEHPGRVAVLTEPDPVWREMEHRNRLLQTARRLMDATHIVTIDADELLTGNLIALLPKLLNEHPRGHVLQVPWVNLRNSLYQYHSTGVWGRALVSIAFDDEPACHWSSENRGGYDFHHRHPMGREFVANTPIRFQNGGLLHLQMANDRRLRAKQALYKMIEVTRWPGRDPVAVINRRYNPAVYGTPEKRQDSTFETRAVPASWWAPYSDLMKYLHLDATPWQEAECKRMYELHGCETFTGLDLFGVI